MNLTNFNVKALLYPGMSVVQTQRCLLFSTTEVYMHTWLNNDVMSYLMWAPPSQGFWLVQTLSISTSRNRCIRSWPVLKQEMVLSPQQALSCYPIVSHEWGRNFTGVLWSPAIRFSRCATVVKFGNITKVTRWHCLGFHYHGNPCY